MKRFLLFISVYTIFLCIPIKADIPEIQYKIYADSQEGKVYEYKEEVVMMLDYLCNNVDEDSYKTLIKEKLDVFKNIANSEVRFKGNTLYITIGDGQGKRVNGTYKQNNTCFEQVKPKSKIMEMLGMGND